MGADRPGQRMHRFDGASDALANEVVAYALERVRLDPPPLDGTASLSDLRARVGSSLGRAPRDPLEVLIMRHSCAAIEAQIQARDPSPHLAPLALSVGPPSASARLFLTRPPPALSRSRHH